MVARMVLVVVSVVVFAGCSVSAITTVHEAFPKQRGLIHECREYWGGSFSEVTQDMLKREAAGWTVKLTGYERSFWFGIYVNHLYVCYVKPTSG